MVAVGDELLTGDVVNTNAAFLGLRLRRLGLPLRSSVVVRDRIEEIASAILDAAASGAAVCLVSGGLGPTTDDLTSAAVARAAGVPLRRDDSALARLRAKFASLGRAMPESNLKQAEFPEGARLLPNPIGSAEGFERELHGCRVYVMPGVPRELERMMVEQVEPRLSAAYSLQPHARRIYRFLGRGESSLAHTIEPIVERARQRSPGLAAMIVHYRAVTPEVELVLEGAPDDLGRAATLAELMSLDAEIASVGRALYGVGESALPIRVVASLRERALRLGCAESCTGGGFGRRLAAVPGASDVFEGGVIAYDNRVKHGLLGVSSDMLESYGAVSEPVAQAMAAGVRARLGVDVGVGITGIAGPGGGTTEKPVGTVHVAVADEAGALHQQLRLRGDRRTIQRASELWALKLVWDRLGVDPFAGTWDLDAPIGVPMDAYDDFPISSSETPATSA